MVGIKIGIDFGSANVTVVVEGRGVVICEPSVMVCDASSGKVLAMGHAAREMLGKLPPSLVPVFPIKDGLVNDFEAARMMLSRYIEKIAGGKLFRPNVLLCVPSTVNEIALKSLFNVVMAAGAGSVCCVSEALASAIGAGVSLTDPKGVFVCDIGGAVTDCAVITMGNIAVSRSVNVGGGTLTQAITEYVLRQYRIDLGESEAEKVKRTVGAAVLRKDEISVFACGKHADSGLPAYAELNSTEIYYVLKPFLDSILTCIRDLLEETTPELCGDLIDSGVILTGGTSNLYGTEEWLGGALGVRAVRADEAERCAAEGVGKLLKNMKYLERNGYVFAAPGEDESYDRQED